MRDAYKKAGVNIEAGYEAVNKIKNHVKKTRRLGVMGQIGGFGGAFDLSALPYEEPVLVSGTDGVGTKLKIAFMMDRHDTIGIDCVAMCVNDIVVQGAEPLFFLDYIGIGKVIPEKVEQIVQGISTGCIQAGCALIGGETAEMPGLYEEDEYDLAGFAVGACEKSDLITGEEIKEGDILIGLASNGIHSNGYSLVRKIFFDKHQLPLDTKMEKLDGTLGEELLKPTRIYVKSILQILENVKVNGMAHITGGGFYENIPRMLPDHLGAEIVKGSWPILPIFEVLEEYGELERDEMFHIFNMGIGFIIAVPQDEADLALKIFQEIGEKAYKIGKVVQGTGITWTSGENDH